MSLNRKLTILLSACSLGIAGCSMPNPEKLDKDGKAFVAKTIDEQLHSWNAEKLQSHLDPRSGANLKDTQALFQTFETELGPIEKIDSLESNQSKLNIGTGPDYSAQYKTAITCAKAKGTLNITAIHQNNKWTIASFTLNSDALKHIDQAGQYEAKVFVDKIAKEIFDGWHLSTLKTNADTMMVDNIKGNPVLVEGILWGSRQKLGKLTKYEGSKFANIVKAGGRTYYLYVVRATFEKDKAEMLLGVVKIGKVWKLNQFNIHSIK